MEVHMFGTTVYYIQNEGWQQLQHVSSRVNLSPGVTIPFNSIFNYTTI